jgi:hypothetical protein
MKVTMASYKKHLGSLPVTYWGLCYSYFYFEKFAHKYKQHKQDMNLPVLQEIRVLLKKEIQYVLPSSYFLTIVSLAFCSKSCPSSLHLWYASYHYNVSFLSRETIFKFFFYWFNPALLLCLSEARIWIPNLICHGLFYVQWFDWNISIDNDINKEIWDESELTIINFLF